MSFHPVLAAPLLDELDALLMMSGWEPIEGKLNEMKMTREDADDLLRHLVSRHTDVNPIGAIPHTHALAGRLSLCRRWACSPRLPTVGSLE